MRPRFLLRAKTAAMTVLVAGAGLAALATETRAQGLIFDWGGEKKTTDSGKSQVKFNSSVGKAGDLIVSFGDRKLYFFTGPGEADTYPIAIPRDQSRWEGITTVSMKRENPSWTPTANMLRENPKLPRWVPGGHEMNPLGIRALYLGSSDYRIHGTDAPWTIGTPVSKGCVRMFNKDVVDLYPRVKVGSKVTVTWQKFDGKALLVSTSKGITELPPPPPVASAPADKPQVAAVQTDEPSEGVRTKARKRFDDSDDGEPVVAAKPVAAESEKTAPVAQDDSGRKKRPQVGMIGEAEDATTEIKPRADVRKEPARAVPNAPAEQAAKPERRVRTATQTKPAAKSDTSLETGTLAPNVAKSGTQPKPEDNPALGIAMKALAAAERAAASAERAAALAERAVSASQQRAETDVRVAKPVDASGASGMPVAAPPAVSEAAKAE